MKSDSKEPSGTEKSPLVIKQASPVVIKMMPQEKTFIDYALPISQFTLSIAIGIVTAYVAYQQYRINRRKLTSDQYDRRFKIYDQVIGLIISAVQQANLQMEELSEFIRATKESPFLFGKDIKEYIDELYKQGVDLHYANKRYCDSTKTPPPGYDHEKVVDTQTEKSLWFNKQLSAAPEKFKRYLDISKT